MFLTNRRICEYLLVRDTTAVPNVLWFEYNNVKAEVKKQRNVEDKSN